LKYREESSSIIKLPLVLIIKDMMKLIFKRFTTNHTLLNSFTLLSIIDY